MWRSSRCNKIVYIANGYFWYKRHSTHLIPCLCFSLIRDAVSQLSLHYFEIFPNILCNYSNFIYRKILFPLPLDLRYFKLSHFVFLRFSRFFSPFSRPRLREHFFAPNFRKMGQTCFHSHRSTFSWLDRLVHKCSASVLPSWRLFLAKLPLLFKDELVMSSSLTFGWWVTLAHRPTELASSDKAR